MLDELITRMSHPPPQQGYNTGIQQPGYGAPQQNHNGAPQQNHNGAPNQQAYPLPTHLPGQVPMQSQMQLQMQVLTKQSQTPWKPGAPSDNSLGFKWDDMPIEDLEEKAPLQEGLETYKALAAFESVPGYENVALNDGPSLLPPVYGPPPEESKPPETFKGSVTLSDDAVRAAMLQFVDKHCCYGNQPAKEMKYNSIDPSSALHYQLETFTEGRHTRGAQEAYRGGYVDGPRCGTVPTPWQVECQPSSMFQNHTKVMEVPHTSVIRTCYRCVGRGFLRCPRCCGSGRVRCDLCGGAGAMRERSNNDSYRCHSCLDSGRKRCQNCGGDGRITCHTCNGYRSLRHYVELVVKFINHIEDYILEEMGMPDDLIRDVSGQVIFEQTLPYVWPITRYPIQQINAHSTMIVNNHRKAWPYDRMLQQRQILRSVPVSEVNYTWKDHNKRFWVFGFEHDVYAPDYPHQCCWGCNVL